MYHEIISLVHKKDNRCKVLFNCQRFYTFFAFDLQLQTLLPRSPTLVVPVFECYNIVRDTRGKRWEIVLSLAPGLQNFLDEVKNSAGFFMGRTH